MVLHDYPSVAARRCTAVSVARTGHVPAPARGRTAKQAQTGAKGRGGHAGCRARRVARAGVRTTGCSPPRSPAPGFPRGPAPGRVTKKRAGCPKTDSMRAPNGPKVTGVSRPQNVARAKGQVGRGRFKTAENHTPSQTSQTTHMLRLFGQREPFFLTRGTAEASKPGRSRGPGQFVNRSAVDRQTSKERHQLRQKQRRPRFQPERQHQKDRRLVYLHAKNGRP